MQITNRWLYCAVVTASCAPSGAQLGSHLASSLGSSESDLSAYAQRFEISSTDAAILLDWYTTQGSEVSQRKYAIPAPTKTQVAAQIYQQAMDKGFYKEPNPAPGSTFDWGCLQVRFRAEKNVSSPGSQEGTETLSHIFAHKPNEYGCFDDVFSAVFAKQGTAWIAFNPKSFVFNKTRADSTTECTEHVHYTVAREPHGLRCGNGTDNYVITNYDEKKCSPEVLSKRFAPTIQEPDALLQFTSCGGAVRLAKPENR